MRSFFTCILDRTGCSSRILLIRDSSSFYSLCLSAASSYVHTHTYTNGNANSILERFVANLTSIGTCLRITNVGRQAGIRRTVVGLSNKFTRGLEMFNRIKRIHWAGRRKQKLLASRYSRRMSRLMLQPTFFL